MRRKYILVLVLVMITLLSLPSLFNREIATNSNQETLQPSNISNTADATSPYTGTGSALSVSFSGTFTNLSSWSDSSSTLSLSLTPGVSYSVDNASTVTWTAYVLVSPPAEVQSLSFSVTFPVTDWKPTSVTDPVGVVQSNPTDWYTDYNNVVVRSSAVDIHGLWKLTFLSSNFLGDLQMGPSGGPYGTTTTFDTGDTMKFISTSSWITGASTEFDLLDPSGSVWYSSSNTTSGATSHVLSSFHYRKDITIHNAYVSGNLNGFPVLIDILDTDLHTKVQSNGNDIVFYSGGAIVPHEIELFDQNYSPTQAHLVAWVKLNLLVSTDVIVSMYYGNPIVGPEENPDAVWTSSYSAVWHLAETASNGGISTDYYDSTGHRYYGDQSGTASTTGVFGTGQAFDGTDLINVSAARGLEPSGDVTVSGWFKLNSPVSSTTGTTQVLVTKAIDGDTDMYVLLAGSDYSYSNIPRGAMVFKMENSGGGQKYVWSTRRSWSANTWYFFSCTMDASTPSLDKVYINGIDRTNTTTAGGLATASLAFTADWIIGGGFVDQMYPTEGWFNGVIDEVRVSNLIRPASWIQTEWSMYSSSSLFRTLAAESPQISSEASLVKTVDSTFPAGVWTVAAHYNDSGSSVGYRVGEYQRNFIVRRASTLDITSPSDAAAGLETMTVGDLLYLVVTLQDTGTSAPITGATVSMNWTVTGSGTTEYFEDLGDGRYSIARNTSELSDKGRWFVNISSTHPYYLDSSASFNLDLYHPTKLTYQWVNTTPVGFDFAATLVYRDTWDGSLISGATITYADGSPVSVTPAGTGLYNISIPTGALSKGLYYYSFNATDSSNFYRHANVEVSFQLRAHYTAVSVSGNLITPIGQDTTVNIVLVDLDTGVTLDESVVDSLTFTSSYGTQPESSLLSLNGITLDTSTWSSVGTTSVDLDVVMSNSDYSAPATYSFNVQIRNHKTAATVLGSLTSAYGADTPITVSITDLDGGTINIANVNSFSFASSQGTQFNGTLTSFSLDLKTSTWPVSSIQVTLTVIMNGNYDDPANYVFTVTIRALQTTLYNEPNDLIFPQEYDFYIIMHLNVSESGQYYGDPIDGQSGQFTVTSGTTTYLTTITPLANGMYNISIAWSYFIGGEYFSIKIQVNPADSRYAATSVVINFKYRPATSDLTANLYTVSTPYNKNVTIHLYYRDLDRDAGITTGTISTTDAPISWTQVSAGDYQVDIDVSGFGIGSHAVNLTASALSYQTRWLIITLVVTQIHTDAEPTVIHLQIPSGNNASFYIDWADLDNGVSLQATTTNTNWTNSDLAWTGTRYLVTIVTDGSEALGTYLVWFTFSINSNYQDGYCEIQVEIRSHDTILTADTPPPTAYNSIVNVSVYYYDFDNKVGIKDALVHFYVENATGSVSSSYAYDLALGDGYYTISIPASQFGIGVPQTFTIYVEWLGAIQQYENNLVVVSTTIVGVDCIMTMNTAADPTPYLEIMTYSFYYSEKDSGTGITNSTDQGYGIGHVHISVSFDVAFDMGKLTITEVNPITDAGLYRIDIDTTGFGQIGQFTMTITIDWTGGSPSYSTLEDSASVWVLARSTTLLINPPSPESYGENASFSFNWEDTGLGTNILDSPELSISMDIAFNYVHSAGLFTITFNTSQFGSTGAHVITLNVTWAGAPFYGNKTNRLISITVLTRQTVLDYPTPDPTFYGDNVTITVTWTDVTNGANDGILGATITVTDDLGVINPSLYSVRQYAGGVYEIEFSTTRYPNIGRWNITILMHVPATYILDKMRTQALDLRERRTILSYEAVGKVAYGDPIEFTMYFEDLYTSSIIGNGTGSVKLEILTAGSWSFTSTWNSSGSRYDVVIYAYPAQSIGSPFNIDFRMSYADVAPFYQADDLAASFELRERLSLLSLEVAPSPTPYLDFIVFQVQYLDVDSDTGILADDIQVYFGATPLTNNISGYIYSSLGAGLYELSVNSTAFGGLNQYTVTVYALWTSGVPYHGDASTPVKVRVTTRNTIVDILVPPTQTPFLNDVSLTFEYTDLSSGTPITSILVTNILLYNNGSLVNPSDYTLTPSGSAFILLVNSEKLGTTLSRYNLTIVIDWNQATAPYYVDAQTSTWVNVVSRSLSFALDPLDETPFGHLLNITFTLTDLETASPVDGAIITFSAQAISLTPGTDYNITSSLGGVYLIEIDTSAFPTPGSYDFDLTIDWNPSLSPYYKSLKTLVITGVIGNIETELSAWKLEVTVNWQDLAPINVTYTGLVLSDLIPDADVSWEIAGVTAGSLNLVLPEIFYFAEINTTDLDAGIYIISVTAEKAYYQTARVYITLIVQPLESNITPIDPIEPVHLINRGASLPITILLLDSNSKPISNNYFISGSVKVESGGTYTLSYNGTPGYYLVILPENNVDATKKSPGSYTITVTASLHNYEPAAYSFKIQILQTETAVTLARDTNPDMSYTYTQNVTVYVDLILPTELDTPFWNATVSWIVADTSISGNFSSFGNGTYYALIKTAVVGFGIWNLIFKATPFENASLYAGSQTIISFAVKRIQTTYTLPETRDFYWGWAGYLKFVYWDETFNRGITGAQVYIELAGLENVIEDLGNGTYLVYFDTSLTLASSAYFPLVVSFGKLNYIPQSATINIRVLEVPTEINVHQVEYTPSYAGTVGGFENLSTIPLQIPLGDTMTIYFFYNDTDNSDGYVGGLAGAFPTLNSYLRGPTIDSYLNVTVVDLGNGLYSVTFDTSNEAIKAAISSEAYRLYIEMSLQNRTTSEVLFRITVINIPTSFSIVNDQAVWSFTNGQSLTIEFQYWDTWHNVGIAGAHFSANASRGAPFTVRAEEGNTPGQYSVIISSTGIKLSPGSGTVTIKIGQGVYTLAEDAIVVELVQSNFDIIMTNSVTYGVPLLFIVLLIGFAYVRIWSVPKQLRKINSQIKTIRKGTIPKPIMDAKSRQTLIAALFNDTFEKIAITRTADEMPPESIPVEVPELGELLIQLAILTNLDQQELDDFKADISKMKISEQAAFVNEVIMQEAIRAARRENKTVEQIIEEVQAQAAKRVAGEAKGEGIEAEEAEEEEPEVERVILEKRGPTDREHPATSDEHEPTVEEDAVVPEDRLSPFEIDELKKDLESKGVPAHEIDTILKQARELPRDLVEELIRSLGKKKRS